MAYYSLSVYCKPCWPRQQAQSDNFPCPLQLIKVTPGLGNYGSNQPEPKPAPSNGGARGLRTGVRTRASASTGPDPVPVTVVAWSVPGAWATCRGKNMR